MILNISPIHGQKSVIEIMKIAILAVYFIEEMEHDRVGQTDRTYNPIKCVELDSYGFTVKCENVEYKISSSSERSNKFSYQITEDVGTITQSINTGTPLNQMIEGLFIQTMAGLIF